MKDDDIRKTVRENYGKIAVQQTSCCGPASGCCCNSGTNDDISKAIGYSDEELRAVPEGANLGLGCGNPTALASLKEGEVVVDLGSGGGFDCFLAAEKVGETGKVIGIDMTAEMLETARENARNGEYRNVEFRLGEIENLPVADNSADVIISNCVINLSPDKKRVFNEAFRVLKPGGRIMVSDIVLEKKLPDAIMNSIEAYVGCIAGAMLKEEYLKTVKSAGLEHVNVIDETVFPVDYIANDPVAQKIIEGLSLSTMELRDIGNSILSVKVSAVKPE